VPQNGEDEIAFCRFRDLLLEGGTRLVEFAFPADGFKPGNAGEFAVQTLDNPLDPHALEMRVAGRRNEDADRSHLRTKGSETNIGKTNYSRV
jgi:hypothetical protein